MKRSVWTMMMAGCVALLAACNEAPTEVVPAEMELQQARALWEARGADDYDMRVRLTGAWFNGAAEIWVRGGTPVWVHPVGPNSGGLSAQVFSSYDTVEEMFRMLELADREGASLVEAAYHAEYGLPVDVFIDWRQTHVDDESGFIVESFELR